MEIIKEEDVTLYGDKNYRKITYADGNSILRCYDKEIKMWITLHFSQEDDTEVIENIKKAMLFIFKKPPVAA